MATANTPQAAPASNWEEKVTQREKEANEAIELHIQLGLNVRTISSLHVDIGN